MFYFSEVRPNHHPGESQAKKPKMDHLTQPPFSSKFQSAPRKGS
jgi:hypothetical protein